MSHFAFEGGVSTDPVEGAVSISGEEYQDALDAIIAGREVTIDGGFALREKKPTDHHKWEHGEWVEHPPEAPEPLPPTLEDYENAIQATVDAAAKTKLFRDGVTLASYTASTNPQWAAEAVAFVAWRDQIWAYSYTELAKVQAGQRDQPTVEEFLTELPDIIWPE